MLRHADPVWAIAAGAVAATVVSFWLPIFQVGGFVYTMIDAYRGRDQFLAAAALPVALGVAAIVCAIRHRGAFGTAALAGVVMCTLAPVDHLTEAAWMREHPERLGAPFEFRIGFAVALVGIVSGAVVFIAVVRALLAEPPTERDADGLTNVAAGTGAVGLLVAVAGQLAESSSAHLWDLPRWPQAGRWWELLVTSAICAIAVWRRRPAALAAAAVVSIAATASAVQQLDAVSSQEGDPAVSSTVTLAGFTIVMVAVATALVGSLRSGSVVRRA